MNSIRKVTQRAGNWPSGCSTCRATSRKRPMTQCPLWVISGHSAIPSPMSAFGGKADTEGPLFESCPFLRVRMSAIGCKADVRELPSGCLLIARSGHSRSFKPTLCFVASMVAVGAVHRIINGHSPSELGPPDAIHRIHSFTANCFWSCRDGPIIARAEFPCRYELLRQIGQRP